MPQVSFFPTVLLEMGPPDNCKREICGVKKKVQARDVWLNEVAVALVARGLDSSWGPCSQMM